MVGFRSTLLAMFLVCKGQNMAKLLTTSDHCLNLATPKKGKTNYWPFHKPTRGSHHGDMRGRSITRCTSRTFRSHSNLRNHTFFYLHSCCVVAEAMFNVELGARIRNKHPLPDKHANHLREALSGCYIVVLAMITWFHFCIGCPYCNHPSSVEAIAANSLKHGCATMEVARAQ